MPRKMRDSRPHAKAQTAVSRFRQSIERALVEAPLTNLAGVAQTEPDALVRKLKSQGIEAGARQSIRTLARLHDVSEHRLLAIVFSPEP